MNLVIAGLLMLKLSNLPLLPLILTNEAQGGNNASGRHRRSPASPPNDQTYLISAPFLTHGWVKLQTILGNEELSAVTTLSTSTGFADLLQREKFEVKLVADVLYQMKE